MNPKYSDIINNEYLVEYDREKLWKQLHQRDRKIYLHALESGTLTDHSSRYDILRVWQSTRLQSLFSKPQNPGQSLSTATQYANSILLFLSFVCGITAMASFLYYTGQNAVNVLSFFLTFIIIQWCLLVASCVLQKKVAQPPWFSCIKWAINFWYQKLSPEDSSQKKEVLHSLLGRLWQKSDFISLVKPYIFVVQQKIALFFNLGLLLTLCVRIISTDLAFGWQSTLNITNEGLHRAIHVLSMPWAWTNIPTPDLTQIAGSKIILKDGLFHLAQSDLISWWPFLIMSLISYAFLPRCIFYTYALLRERQNLSRFNENTRSCENILQRMQSPVVTSHIEKTTKDIKTAPEKNFSSDSNENIRHKKALLLIPYELPPLDASPLRQWLQEEGYSIAEQQSFMKSYHEDQTFLEQIDCLEKDIIIIMEAHMPPLAEFLSFIQTLQRKTAVYIHIFLVNYTKNSFSKTLSKDVFQIWNHKINALANIHIRVIPPDVEEQQ